MHKTYLTAGALLAALAVALGAFGAHGLKKLVSPETVTTFQTGVQYQFYHTLALFFVAILFEKFSNKWMKWAGILFITGIILFSGSLYLLTAIKATETIGMEGLGIVTPFGGLAFIAGWLSLFAGIIKKN
ncbi:MAG: DUF423 domain-containing protein [Chitinophagaceae bacterium]|nr:DUF423 domain-containing protein [Chitinophagaceae bacterium]